MKLVVIQLADGTWQCTATFGGKVVAVGSSRSKDMAVFSAGAEWANKVRGVWITHTGGNGENKHSK